MSVCHSCKAAYMLTYTIICSSYVKYLELYKVIIIMIFYCSTYPYNRWIPSAQY